MCDFSTVRRTFHNDISLSLTVRKFTPNPQLNQLLPGPWGHIIGSDQIDSLSEAAASFSEDQATC